ncbi:MAG: putative amino-acid metabolite efflux pump [Calditrichaeota bacterium]|nr:putative amino-acid metabolite efflux pump [Calditrichota bacterium]
MSPAKSGLTVPTVLIALSVMGLWGFSFSAIKIALRELTAWELVILRFLPTLAVFLVVLASRAVRGTFRIPRRDLPVLFLAGLFGVAAYNFALNSGQTRLPASLAALVIALNPAMIAVVATVWLGERPRLRTWLGLLVALAGIVFVVFARYGTPELRVHHLVGIGITFGAPVSWGIYTSSIRRAAPKLGTVVTTMTAISLGSLPLVLMIGPELTGKLAAARPETIGAVLFLSLACTVYGFTMWGYVLKRVEAATAGAFIYLVPLIAAFAAHWLLGEPIDLPLVGGGILVLLGVALATGMLRRILPGPR